MSKHFARKYLREEVLPSTFCPGCFNGIVINAFLKAVEELNADLRKVVLVSGIGCSSWIPSPHIKADSIHTLHGRAIAVATGVKIVRPDLNVVVISGDGDLASIGGNHLIHAARRNMDLLVIMVNNLVYGMTRGQASPTTPIGLRTTTTPYGNFELPMDVCRILEQTNANYVARWCISNFFKLKDSIKEAFFMRGFRFIEVYAPCITYVVRYEGKTAGEKIKELFSTCIPREMVDRAPQGKKVIEVGVFKKEDKPGYIEMYSDYRRSIA